MPRSTLGPTLAALLPLAISGWAVAGETVPAPLCSRPAVLAHLAERLREAGRRVALDKAPVGEFSLPTGRVVHCAVRGHVISFDTKQHGTQPIDASFTVRYALELGHNGIFLQLE